MVPLPLQFEPNAVGSVATLPKFGGRGGGGLYSYSYELASGQHPPQLAEIYTLAISNSK